MTQRGLFSEDLDDDDDDDDDDGPFAFILSVMLKLYFHASIRRHGVMLD
jgi:hypothetical protein